MSLARQRGFEKQQLAWLPIQSLRLPFRSSDDGSIHREIQEADWICIAEANFARWSRPSISQLPVTKLTNCMAKLSERHFLLIFLPPSPTATKRAAEAAVQHNVKVMLTQCILSACSLDDCFFSFFTSKDVQIRGESSGVESLRRVAGWRCSTLNSNRCYLENLLLPSLFLFHSVVDGSRWSCKLERRWIWEKRLNPWTLNTPKFSRTVSLTYNTKGNFCLIVKVQMNQQLFS